MSIYKKLLEIQKAVKTLIRQKIKEKHLPYEINKQRWLTMGSFKEVSKEGNLDANTIYLIIED